MRKEFERQSTEMAVRKQIEESVIGSCLISPEAINRVKDILKPDYFLNDNLKGIYNIMVYLANHGEKIDLLTVSTILEGKGKLEEIGGRAYLVELIQSIPTASHIVTYAKRLIHLYGLYKIKVIHEKFKPRIEEGDDDVLSEYRKELENIEKEVANEINLDEFKIANLVDLVNESRAKRNEGAIEGYKTGFSGLDKILRGQLKGKMWVIAGYNSFGKSTLGINLMVNACKDGAKAIFFSCEMGREETTNRVLACLSDKELKHFIYPTSEDIGEVYDKAMKLNMTIIDTVDDIDRIISVIKEQVAKNKVDVVYIDYLQNLSSQQFPERTKMLEYASKKLRVLALQENICIIALSQLNEEAVKIKNTASSGIKGSGDVSSASDVTIKVVREKNKDDTFTDYFGIQIFKSRYSQLGIVECMIHPERCKIVEITKRNANN